MTDDRTAIEATIQEYFDGLHEGDADKLLLQSLRDLYSRPGQDSVTIIVLKDLYDLIEKVVDRCRDAGNVVSHIVFKNS